MEGAPSPDLAFQRHGASVQRDQTARHGQSQPDPLAAPAQSLDRDKGFENALLLINRDPDARVFHPDMQMRRLDLGPQQDMAGGW